MFIRQTILYLPAHVIAMTFQFLAIIVWTHFLEPADFGRFTLVVAVHELVFLLLLWWSFYTLRSLGDWSDEKRRERFKRTEGFVLLVVLFLHVVLVTILVVTIVDQSASLALVAASIAFAVSRSLVMYLTERTRTAQQIWLYTILLISWAVIGFGAGLVLVLMFGSSAVWPLLGTAGAQLLAAAYVMWRARVRPIAFQPDMEVLRAAVKFGLPLIGGGLLSWFSLFGNRFIIEYFLDYADVGLYSVGSGVAERAVALGAVLVGAATLPLAIQDMRESGTPAAMHRLKIGGIAVLGLMIPAAVGVSVLATPIAEVLVGPQYREATILLIPAGAWAAVVYHTWCALPAQALILVKKTGVLTQYSSAMAVLTVAFSVALIQPFGILGVAYAKLAAFFLVFALACYYCVGKVGMLFPARELTKMFVCAAFMALVLWMVPTPRTLLGLLAAIALGALVYFSTAMLLFRNEVEPIAARWRHTFAKWISDYRAGRSAS